jgi:hypothetical protein
MFTLRSPAYGCQKQLQSYVSGVMMPYWDWTDPTSIMTDTFLGPNGSGGSSTVSAEYFAPTAPGTSGNPTPAPAWWPPGLTGWSWPDLGQPDAQRDARLDRRAGADELSAFSPFDPFFYLHHCNSDRIWAMWQADGHADEYPTSGGHAYHNRNDMMYPWIGSTAGFGTNSTVAASIPMPDVSAVGPGTDLIPPGCDADCPLEQFTRILNASAAVID